jgi:disulfide oxidoreductase YuzD
VTDGRGGEVINQVTIAVGNQSSGLADRVDVVYFHRTQRCSTCIHAEELTRYTVETHFADELASGKLTFQSIDVQDSNNAAIVTKYGAYARQLFINTVKDGADHIEQATDLYPLIFNDEAFVETLKSKIEKSLNGET